MIISLFPYFAFVTTLLWATGICFLYSKSTFGLRLGKAFIVFGLALLGSFIGMLWVGLERPPFRTIGETRLWYALFLSSLGLFVQIKFRQRWFLNYSLLMASIFLGTNLIRPDVFETTLMPALQSPWFIPHVVVYIEGYALLAGATIVAIRELWHKEVSFDDLLLADTLVYLGYGFITLGLLCGALWAKEAWGHYWTWDPKETWALLTWLCYLGYIHIRQHQFDNTKIAFSVLRIAFIVLLLCWFGINYLPTAQQSVHTYTN